VFEGDVEEVSRATGGVEDVGGAEFAVEGAGGFDRFFGFVGVDEVGDGGDGVGPVSAEGFDEGGNDETFDVGARGVVCAQRVALCGVKGTFEQGAGDGGFDIAPVRVGGLYEEVELIVIQRQGCGRSEEAAVEAEDVVLQDGREAAIVHGLPEGGGHLREDGDVLSVAQALEEMKPTLLGEEFHVFCEGGEDATGEELGDLLGGVSEFEVAGEEG
jgi:hypothetical protein